LTDCASGGDGQGGGAGGAPQDDLADRQRSTRQRRRLGYVEAADTREAIDITELNSEIARIVVRQAELRGEIDAIVAEIEDTS
jgi:hypothetical protein